MMKKEDSDVLQGEPFNPEFEAVKEPEKLPRLDPPERVKIGYRWYDIELVSEPNHFVKNTSGGNVYGYCDFNKKRIYINDDCDAMEEANTLLHEIVHAIHENFGYGMLDAANWTGENFTIAAANGLSQVFQDNPYFAMYLMVNLEVEGFEALSVDGKAVIQ